MDERERFEAWAKSTLGFWIDDEPPRVLTYVDGGCHPASTEEISMWDALRAARRTTPDRECEWKCDDMDNGIWESGCGETWSFVDGGPTENRMLFCHRCGGKLKTAQLAALDRLAENERELGLDYLTAPTSDKGGAPIKLAHYDAFDDAEKAVRKDVEVLRKLLKGD